MKNHKNSFKAKSHSVLLEQNKKKKTSASQALKKQHKKLHKKKYKKCNLFYNFSPSIHIGSNSIAKTKGSLSLPTKASENLCQSIK